MKYWQPFGISDPDAPYINGDPTIGRPGSIPPAGAFEQNQREIVNLIKYSHLNPNDADVTQLFQATRSQYINYAAADPSTNENQITVVFNPTIGNKVTNGMPLRIKAAKTNTGPCLLIVDGVTSPLRRSDTAELEANDVRAATVFECLWNDTFWTMTNYRGMGGGGPGTVNNYVTKIPYAVDTSTTVNAIVAAYAPAITTLVPGDAIEVKLKNTITGPTTMKANALAPVAVVRGDGSPLHPGDAVVNQIMLLLYTDANRFQFIGILPQSFVGVAMPVGTIILTTGNAAVAGTLKINGALLNRSEHPLLWAFANASGRIVDEAVWQDTSQRSWTAFSKGDAVSTFRLPDFRGEFMRLFDDGRGIDTGRQLSIQQTDIVGQLALTGLLVLNNPKLDMQYGPYAPTGLDSSYWITGGEPSFTRAETSHDWNQPPPVGPGEKSEDVQAPWLFPAFTTSGGMSWPTGWTHKDSRLSANMSLSGSGGGPETRPRNAAVMPCIVDG